MISEEKQNFKLIILTFDSIEEIIINQIKIDSLSAGSFVILKEHGPIIIYLEKNDEISLILEDSSERILNNQVGFFQVKDYVSYLFL